jgi:molybdate transport system ATP-binding protein
LLSEILRDRTALIVTHDLLDALAIADTVVVVVNGRVVEHGPARTVLTAPRSDFAARIAGLNLVSGTVAETGAVRTAWQTAISGIGDIPVGTPALALFRPSAVAVHVDAPHGSPRNVLPVTIAEIDVHGTTVRVRGLEQPDGGTGLSAAITAAAAADLNLEPGMSVYFVVKTQEVQLHPGLPAGRKAR